MKNINFIIKDTEVALDYIDVDSAILERFKENPYMFIYNEYFNQDLDNSNLSYKYFMFLIDYFVQKISHNSDKNIELSETEIDLLLNTKPFFIGSEKINYNWIEQFYASIQVIYESEIIEFNGNVDLYFSNKRKSILQPFKIYFHLVENPQGTKPFAFMITYTKLFNNTLKHYPLKTALIDYKDSQNEFLNLLSSIYTAGKKSELIQKLIDSNEIFEAIEMDTNEAYELLKSIEIFENIGIVCRIPNWWNNKKKSVSVEIDLDQIFRESFGYFNDMSVRFAYVPKLIYCGLEISQDEIHELLTKTDGLAYFKGKWIEVDHTKLNQLLSSYEKYSKDGTSFSEIIKNISGLSNEKIEVTVSNKDWLTNFKDKVINTTNYTLSKNFIGNLRPYQFDGYKWLTGLTQMGFGACLADDMGLGKTIQILAYLSTYFEQSNKKVLLIVPSSLASNWETEIIKFTPKMKYYILRNTNFDILKFEESSLIITTYQISLKIDYLYKVEWGIVILDEAQMIKNYKNITAKKIKSLKRTMSIAMTGTPVENNLMNLWSIFDFINPGLLGSANEFMDRVDLRSSNVENLSKIKNIISPFILRRLKIDKKIISDLPDKLENKIFVDLTKEQIILYNKVVDKISLNKEFNKFSEFEKKSILLATIMHLKQICNHPSQYLGDDIYTPENSGKFMVLKDIVQTIYEKREKVIIFTQFKEIVPALNQFLHTIFGKEGLYITGDIPVGKRKDIVDKFQNEEIPYIILTLKTAGYGLNLTSANNVIHFDRWWNPAVENQATDRAFRIGQTKNVNVYTLTTKNTIEEIIDNLLMAKSDLADKTINDIGNNVISKMSADELLKTINFIGGVN